MKRKQKGELVIPPNAVTQTGFLIKAETLVHAAMQEHAEKQKHKIQLQIRVVVERIETLLPMKRNVEMRLALCDQQLDALRNGEFDVNPLNMHIKFRKAELNVAWDDTAYWGMSDPNEKDDPFRGF